MPNFIAKELRNLAYPFGEGDVRFLWEARGRAEKLVLAECGDEQFFLVVKAASKNKTEFGYEVSDKVQNFSQNVNLASSIVANEAQNAKFANLHDTQNTKISDNKAKFQAKQGYVIKGEKLTRPARVGLLQRALAVYRDTNTTGAVSEAFAVKSSRLTQKAKEIVDMHEFMGDFNDLAAKFKHIFIEIGFGSGRHLLFQAQNAPDTLVIGIEVYKPSIEQVAKLARAQGLENVRLINTDARLLLSLIGSNLIDKIFLHFPVPWEKAEHRRVVSAAFASECERVLKVGANFELRTDVREYCDFSAHHFLNLAHAQLEIYKDRDLAITSKYEQRWRKQEKEIYDLIFTCHTHSKPREIKGELNFTHGYDIAKLASKFKNETIKMENFFVHFEEIYTINEREIMLRVAFGAFNKPEQCFIKISRESAEYFIKKPLLTPENLSAHEILKEYLTNATNH